MCARTLPNPEVQGPDIEEVTVNRPTDPPLTFPWPGIGLVRIRQINSPYHTNFSKSIPSSSVDNKIPLAGKVALSTYARLVYNWYRNIFHMFAVLILFHAANEKTGRKQD